MANKKFLYGLGLGVLGCNIYPLIKDSLHPMAVKMVKGALESYSSAKSFVEEVSEEAKEQRQERFRRRAENFETKSTNSNEEIFGNIELLKKQLEELRNKIKEE